MYDDGKEYLDFLNENLTVSTEELSVKNTYLNVINPNLDWDLIANDFYHKRIAIVDNFLEPEYCRRLQRFMLFFNRKQDYYKDYAAVNFYLSNKKNTWFPLLTSLINDIVNNFKSKKPLNFLRAWSFIYENTANGVDIHADTAAINFNLWVTPDSCLMNKKGFNGLDIWNLYPPENWINKDYNGDDKKIKSYISNSNSQRVSIDYKFNRVIIFDSKLFHSSQPILSYEGYANRRINYTFLFN